MKKLVSVMLVVLFALTSSLAFAHSELARDDYNLFYEIAEFLCDDWDSPYDDLIEELAFMYEVSAEDIYDFIEYASNADPDHVWIPINGGKKYHRHATCSNMIEPRPCTRDMAIDFGFGSCGRCHP